MKKLFLLLLYVLFANNSYANTVFITGANSGIGFSLVKKYLNENYSVIATYRNDSRSKDLLGIKNTNLSLIKVDLKNQNAAQIIKKFVGDRQIDILFNNACFHSNKVSQLSDKLDSKEWLDQFLVCSIQPIKITDVLTENLKKSNEKKVIMIGSRISSFNAAADKNNISNIEAYGYRTAKAALHSGSIVLAKSLIKDDIILVIVHPGRVKTNIFDSFNKNNKNLGNDVISADVSADNLFGLVKKIQKEDYMTFIDTDKNKILW